MLSKYVSFTIELQRRRCHSTSIRKCRAQIGIAIIEIILFEKGKNYMTAAAASAAATTTAIAGDEIVSFRFHGNAFLLRA